MRAEYDFSKSRKNPYARLLKRNARTRLRAGAQHQTRRQVFAKDPAQRALVTFRAPFQLRDHSGVGKSRPGDGE